MSPRSFHTEAVMSHKNADNCTYVIAMYVVTVMLQTFPRWLLEMTTEKKNPEDTLKSKTALQDGNT